MLAARYNSATAVSHFCQRPAVLFHSQAFRHSRSARLKNQLNNRASCRECNGSQYMTATGKQSANQVQRHMAAITDIPIVGSWQSGE